MGITSGVRCGKTGKNVSRPYPRLTRSFPSLIRPQSRQHFRPYPNPHPHFSDSPALSTCEESWAWRMPAKPERHTDAWLSARQKNHYRLTKVGTRLSTLSCVMCFKPPLSGCGLRKNAASDWPQRRWLALIPNHATHADLKVLGSLALRPS